MTMRLAISGTGYIADTHAKAIHNCAGIELVAVVKHSDSKAREFVKKHPVQAIYSTVDELIHSKKVDGLVVAVPNALHASQTITALKAGVAVMVEKPMSVNSREAQQMLQASQKNKTPLMVAHCWRFDTEVNWLKKQADAGKLGRIVRTKGYGVHVNWGPSGWFTQKTLAGGGALVDMGVHALDTARYLLGDPLPKSVYAHISKNYIEGDVDDTGIIIVNWENGTVSYIESGWWQPHSDGPEAATQLYGTKGFGSVFPTKLRIPNKMKMLVEEINAGFKYPRKEQCPQEMYDRQMQAFIDAIRTRKTPTPGGLEGMINMKILDAAYKSASSRKAVNF